MQNTDTDMTEIHLPERWAVLEEALRQMNAEDSANNRSDQSHRATESPNSAQSRHTYMR